MATVGEGHRWSHRGLAYFQSQILTRLSLPPVTKRRSGCGPPAWLLEEETRLPGMVAGAQETPLAPMPCAGKILCDQELSANSSTETAPSDEAHARRQPDS